MRRAAPATLVFLLVSALGCGNGSHGGCPNAHGIVLLSWTIRGQAASTQTCSSIDHINLSMSTNCGGLTIDPIPCVQGAHWEYDNLPEGLASVVLDAVDAHDVIRAEGVGEVTLSSQKPATPTAIDLN